MEANNPLMDIIRLRIREEGPISFHDFMEMCLYYPELGYYTNTADKIGAGGDFYTSCCLTPAFGAMVARQLEEIWRVLGKVDFTIVEYGAGTGMLCRDILAYLKEIPELYEGLRYCIIEISPTMRNIEQTNLLEKVSWHNGIEDIDGGVHCVLSNELFDNFPIHQVVMKETPMEVFVDFDGCFREILVPASARIESYFNEMGIELAPGFRTEVNLDAQNWINNIADRLRSGFIVTIDYGGCSEELLQERRRCGTLLCYRAHQRSDDLDLSPEWVDEFRNHGIEVIHWTSVGKFDAPDVLLMEWARTNDHIVFTHDLDFGTALALTNAEKPSVIQVRTQDVL